MISFNYEISEHQIKFGYMFSCDRSIRIKICYVRILIRLNEYNHESNRTTTLAINVQPTTTTQLIFFIQSQLLESAITFITFYFYF